MTTLKETQIALFNNMGTVLLHVSPKEVSSSDFSQLSKRDQLFLSPERYFQSNLCVDGGDIEIEESIESSTESSDSPLSIKSLVWTLKNQRQTLILTPLVDEVNDNSSFHKLEIDMSGPIEPHCFIIRQENGVITIDAVIESGILITLQFQLSDFSHHPINWCYVSIPYDFETRPLSFIQAVSNDTMIIFFKDGGIARCSRDRFGESMHVTLFSDTSYISSRIGRLGRFWGSSNMDNDVDAVVDSFVVDKKYVVGLTVGRNLKLWDIFKGVLVSQIEVHINAQEFSEKLFGDGNPMNLMSCLDDNGGLVMSKNRSILPFVIRLPVASQSYQLWQLDLSKNEFVQTTFEFAPPVLDDSALWFANDFKVVDSLHGMDQSAWLHIVVLYKSGPSRCYTVFTLSEDGRGSWQQTKPFVGLVASGSASIVDRIFESYDLIVVETAAAVYHQRHPIELEVDLSLREKVTFLVGKQDDWQVFDGLCSELQRSASEARFLTIYTRRILGTNSVGNEIFHSAYGAHLICCNTGKSLSLVANLDDMVKNAIALFDAINEFKNSLSSEIISNLKRALKTKYSGSVIEHGNKIFEQFLSRKVPVDALEKLVTALNTVPDALQVIQYLLSLQPDSNLEEVEVFPKFNVSKTRDQLSPILDINFGIALMGLVVKLGDEMASELLERSISTYKKAGFAQDMTYISLAGEHINIDTVKTFQSSVFALVCDNLFHYSPFVLTEKLYYSVLNYLSRTNNSELILNTIFSYDIIEDTVTELFKGLSYLNADQAAKGEIVLRKISQSVVDYQFSSEAQFASILKKFLKINDLGEYYHIISQCFADLGHYHEAQSLAKTSIECKATVEFSENLFKIALKTQDFKTAFQALPGLDTKSRKQYLELFITTIIGSSDLKNLPVYPFSPLDVVEVDKILQEQAESITIESRSSIADISQSLEVALKRFKILYSWRLSHGDSRGACQALYQYICLSKSVLNESSTKHKLLIKKQKIICQDLGLCILNLMQTMSPEREQWFLKLEKESRAKYGIMRREELEKEIRG